MVHILKQTNYQLLNLRIKVRRGENRLLVVNVEDETDDSLRLEALQLVRQKRVGYERPGFRHGILGRERILHQDGDNNGARCNSELGVPGLLVLKLAPFLFVLVERLLQHVTNILEIEMITFADSQTVTRGL